jgi:predicted permease
MDNVGWIDALGKDIRYAGRRLRRSPGFTLVAIMTLALGIGANIAAFTVVRAVLLNPLPFPHPEQLVRVFDDLRGSNGHDVGMSAPELWDLRDRSGVFENISAIWPTDANLTGSEKPARIELLATSTNYFGMLGAHPQIGRLYNQNDERPGFIDGAVLSDGFWRRAFGGDPAVLGQSIRLDGDLYTIIGVMPPEFRHPGRSLAGEVEVWTAAGFNAAPFPVPARRSRRMLPGAVGRLKPGMTIAQAQARLNAFTVQLAHQFPVDYPALAGWEVRLVPLEEDLVGNMRPELLVLFGAVALVLLIACVNLANLLLARSAGRQQEIALRWALGAGTTRLIGQLLAESILLSFFSGVVALTTLVCAKTWLVKLAAHDLPRINEISIGPEVLLFAFFVSILTGAIFGLVPALQTVRPSQAATLREGSRGSGTSKRQNNILRTLVGAEIAISLVLLIGAGLLMQSFRHLLEVRPGFEPHCLVIAKIWLAFPNNPENDPYRVIDKRAAFYQEVLRRVAALPGVEQAAVGSAASLPMDSVRRQTPFVIEGRAAESERAPVAAVVNVSASYFAVLKTPLEKGRVFTEADVSSSQPVAVINEALERQYWPNEDPVGKSVRLLGLRGNDAPVVAIVGVVGNIKADGFDAADAPFIYTPEPQSPPYGSVVYLRTSVDPRVLGESIRREVLAVDSTVPAFGIRAMDDVVGGNLAARRFALEIMGAFAGVAFLLAAIGIYGVMAYTVSQRTSEIGLRMALGAQRADILRLVLAQGGLMIAIGVGAGLLGSAALTRFLATILFEIAPTDPIIFSALAMLLAGVAVLACVAPALRAARVDPLVALRHE